MSDSARAILHARQTAAPTKLRLLREVELGPCSAVAVALRSVSNVWRCTIYAELVPGRPWRIGAVSVPLPTTKGEGSRIVAMATVPGASSWIVEATPDGPPADPTEVAELEIAAADVGTPGLVAIGAVTIIGQRLRYAAGSLAAGATNLFVATTRRIRRVSAWQDGTGGSFGLSGYPSIPLPPFGASTLETDFFGLGAASVQFAAIPAGGGGYLIEYEE